MCRESLIKTKVGKGVISHMMEESVPDHAEGDRVTSLGDFLTDTTSGKVVTMLIKRWDWYH